MTKKKSKTEPENKLILEKEEVLHLSVKRISPAELGGGKLAQVVASTMIRNSKDRIKFMALVEKEKGKYKNIQQLYSKFYGYTPSIECEEWAEISKGYAKFYYEISDIWSLNGGLSYLSEETTIDISKIINKWDYIMSLLTGLESFGRDPSGDSCFFSVIPSPLNTTEIYYFNHENGEVEHCSGYSIADFIASKWGDSDYYDYEDEENTKDIDTESVPKPTFTKFNKIAEDALKKRPYYQDPLLLFKRIHWLMGHPMGEPTFHFAEKMEDAPTYADWEKELPLLEKEPVLANYWLLAHYFLGNNEACRATIEHAKKAKGQVTIQLANQIEKLLDQPKKAKLGKLKPKDLEDLKKETRKNCFPEHLEPSLRISLAQERGDTKIKKLPPEEFKKKVQRGDDLWTIIMEYPEDVETHDKVLKEIAKNDSKLATVVERYFSERKDSYYNEWPYDMEDIHFKLSLPITAAFRSGLKFDADHPKSFSGITKTIGKLDDDNSMDACREAFQKLKQDDPRLEYIIEGLAESNHPKANEIMCVGAWKFFDHLENTIKSVKKTDAQGPTLDNMFKVHSYLKTALEYALDEGNDESEKLTHKVLSIQSGLRVLGTALGRALCVAGNRKLNEYLEYASWYCTGTAGLNSKSLNLDGHFNLSEASIAFVKLAPERAKDTLSEIFNKKYKEKYFMLDVRSGVLAGLLMLEPDNQEFLQWAERILGNRSEQFRVYGVFRGIEEGKVKVAAQWAHYHVYADPNPMVDYTSLIIADAARRAIKATLGETLPPFDSDDEYASRIKKELLPEAIKQPEKYSVEHVFKRIVEHNIRHPKIIHDGGNYLLEQLKYSSDEESYKGDEHRWAAIKALIVQGEQALPKLAEVLDLKETQPSWYTNILYSMRVIEPEASIIQWLLQAKAEELLQELTAPRPRFMPWLDLLSAFTLVTIGEQSHNAIQSALEFRYRYVSLLESSSGWEDLEPTIIRLPRVYSQLGKIALPTLEKVLKQVSKSYQPKEYIKSAIQKQQTLIEQKSKALQISDNGEILIQEKIKGDNYNGPEYSFKITLNDRKLSWNCIVENLYFNSVVKDQRQESKQALSFKDLTEAMDKGNLLLKVYAVLGYTPVLPKAKKKK